MIVMRSRKMTSSCNIPGIISESNRKHLSGCNGFESLHSRTEEKTKKILSVYIMLHICANL